MEHTVGMKRRVFFILFLVTAASALFAQDKPDALKLFRNGRDLESAGRIEDAKATYAQSIDVCKLDLTENPKNMDAYTIYGWALVRLGKYADAISICQEALKITSDYRITETLGEAFFYTSNHKEALKNMEKYIDAAPKGERVSTAYFFCAEVYRIGKQYNKAEIAYSAAIYLEPGISLWWYRLGSVREILGDKPRATEAYQRAIKLRPDYKEANEGLSRVRA
jgi:tetratricopeptide (TPR) repeat protein